MQKKEDPLKLEVTVYKHLSKKGIVMVKCADEKGTFLDQGYLIEDLPELIRDLHEISKL